MDNLYTAWVSHEKSSVPMFRDMSELQAKRLLKNAAIAYGLTFEPTLPDTYKYSHWYNEAGVCIVVLATPDEEANPDMSRFERFMARVRGHQSWSGDINKNRTALQYMAERSNLDWRDDRSIRKTIQEIALEKAR